LCSSKLPKSQQSKAKRALQEIWMAETKKDALLAFDAFIDGWLRGSPAAAGTEHIGCPFLELRLPGCDLIGVDVELLRKLSQSSPRR
jgi:hypothetical protein